MDFDQALLDQRGHGRYEQLDRDSLPPLFLAWRSDAAEPSGAAHAAVRARFEQGEARVRETMAEIAELADRGRAALAAGDGEALGGLMDRNVELRARLFELDPRHLRFMPIAREHGTHANYAGSGGAVVGLRPPAPAALAEAYAAEGAEVLEL
jgi:glucuronokinase